jgi:hypothetical protein
MAVLSGFVMTPQAQKNWCWAAVSVSVFRFFNDLRWPDQCTLVNSIFSDTLLGEDCCQNGATDDCDLGWDISEVLGPNGHLTGQVNASVPFAVLNQEIAVNKAPVVIRVQFDPLP